MTSSQNKSASTYEKRISALQARFVVRPSVSRRKPWLVEDTAAPMAEDPVLYHFTSKVKANAFRTMMIAERSKNSTDGQAE